MCTMEVQVSKDGERFNAAVKVVSSLPKNGPFQPSNELKLRFYAYYKQATVGPCHESKPGFWDVVRRAKWDAWKSLGEMSSNEAMQGYVACLQQVVETMSVDNNVQEFLESLGPFYEFVGPDGQAIVDSSRSASTSDAERSNEDGEYAQLNGAALPNGDLIDEKGNASNQFIQLPVTCKDLSGSVPSSKAAAADVPKQDFPDEDDAFSDATDVLLTNQDTLKTRSQNVSLESSKTSDGLAVCAEQEEKDDPSSKKESDRRKSRKRDNRARFSNLLETEGEFGEWAADMALAESANLIMEKLSTLRHYSGDKSTVTNGAGANNRRKHRKEAKGAAASGGSTGGFRSGEGGVSGAVATTSDGAAEEGGRAASSNGEESSEGGSSPELHWDPHVAAVLLRMHRELQQITRQLDLMEQLLVTQQRLLHASIERAVQKTVIIRVKKNWS